MAGTFSLDISRFIKKSEASTATVVRKIALEAFTGVVQKSPVDTGRFRGNWTVSYGVPSLATTETLDKSGGATIGQIASGVLAAPIEGSIFLSNALPYSIRLERGYSTTQAPLGMVGVTMTEIAARYGV